MPSIAIIAGEASGDLNGAMLAGYLRELMPGVELWGTGCRRMREAGVDLVWESGSSGSIGIFEALKLVPLTFVELLRVRKALVTRRPDLLVMIDFGAFNKRLSGFARRHGIKTVYYFPPGSWRRRPRTGSSANIADKLITPFEWSYRTLKESGADVSLVGHPLLDVVRPSLTMTEFLDRVGYSAANDRVVALLPGSRRQEIKHILPAILGAVKLIECRTPGIKYVVASAGERQSKWIRQALKRIVAGPGWPEIRVVEELTYDALAYSCLAITTSGTATLEGAILTAPMVIVYRGSRMAHLEFALRSKVVLEDHVGLPNIFAEKRICPELIANEASPENIAKAALELLSDSRKLSAMRQELEAVRTILGTEGGSRQASEIIVEELVKQGKQQ